MKEINRQVWNRFVRVAKPFWSSDDKGLARTLLVVLLLLMVSVNGLNVVINYVGGDFMTALSSKDVPKFYEMLWRYAAVFAVGTPIVVFYAFVQQKLGLRWRKWLTENLLDKYLRNRNFYRLNHNSEIDNPDERLHQDITAFCTTALSLLLLVLGSIITLCSFVGILWSISKPLCAVLVVYSIGGTIATIWLGRPLIGLNFQQLRKEADFRFSLVHVRKNAESIAFYQGEEQEGFQIKRRFLEAIKNYSLLIGWQRNLNFLTTGYNYMIALIPSLIIAPLFFQGQIKFGVISQAEMAFAQVLASTSLIVTSFAELSSFVAVVNRLGSFVETLEEVDRQGEGTIATSIADNISLTKLTVNTPDQRETLVRDLSLGLTNGQSLLIVGASGAGKSSVLRSIAGLWTSGDGSITRPDLKNMLFLPQRPHMSLGSLRCQLLYPHVNAEADDEQLQKVLDQVNLGDLAARVGGLDTELDWGEFLSTGEQQRLAFARILVHKPAYVVLDEATSGLDMANEARLYQALRESGSTFISVGHRTSLFQYHDQVLELQGDATWKTGSSAEFAGKTFPAFFDARPDSTVAVPVVSETAV